MELIEKIVESDYKYKGKIINVRKDIVKLPDDNTSTREVVEHPGGVCIIAITDDNNVLLVKQFRAGPRTVLLELPAGKLEYGEDPKECGKRELTEETGYVANKFEKIGEYYLSPGYANEKIYIYLAQDLSYANVNPDADEFLEIVKMPFTRLDEMVKNNEITDAKTVIGVMYAKLYKNIK